MKIAAQIPQNFLSSTTLDKSNLGYKVESITLDQLSDKKPHGIVIFGIADDQGIKNVGGRVGAREAPAAIRQKLYRFITPDFHYPIYDLGDLLPEANIADTHTEATRVIRQIHRAGHCPIVLGGGHDLVYPEALALLEENETQKLHFINIDAHLDLRDTHNGITSGSPWYLLLENQKYNLKRHHLTEIGLQAHCNAHSLQAYAHEHHVTLYWLKDILTKIPATFRRVIQKYAREKTLVSLDIDAVRSFEAPGCSAPQTLGLSASDMIDIAFEAGKAKQVSSFGIYEVSPPLDQDHRTAQLAAHCILAFLRGREARGSATLKTWVKKTKKRK
jgi:formiminoglutamase